MDYTATLTLTPRFDDDTVLDRLGSYHPALAPARASEKETDREVIVTYPAEDLDQAIANARLLAEHVGTLAGLEVLPTEAWDHREAQVPAEFELVGVTEAAKRLGVTPQAVRARLASGSLPGVRAGRSWVMNAAALRR